VRLEDESVWLTQAQLSELFQRERSVITKHIRNVFGESELEEASVCANFARTAADGKTYRTAYYNLDVIISVGYRQSEGQVIYFRAKRPTGLTICGTTDNIDGEGILYGRRRKR